MSKKFAALALLFILIISVLAGCAAGGYGTASAPGKSNMDRVTGSGAYSKAAPDMEVAPMPAPAASTAPMQGGAAKDASGEAGNVNLVPDPNQKMIYTGNLEIETLEFDKSLSALNLLLSKNGGYIQNSNITGVSKLSSGQQVMRSAQLTVRVPAENIDAFLNAGGDIGNVLIKNKAGKDVTDSYFDTEARLTSQKLMEQRLLELLSKSDKLTDILSLEQSLADVRYQIENLTGTLRKWDSLIAYSTVSVNIHEVIEVSPATSTPKTLGERLINSFKNSLKGLRDGLYAFIVFLAGAVPYLIVWGLIIAAVIIVLLRIRKRNLKKARLESEKQTPALPEEDKPDQK